MSEANTHAGWEPSGRLEAELDRVGVTYRKAGAARYVHVYQGGDVYAAGAPNEIPRRHWHGPELELLDALAGLDVDAGVDAFWAALDRG